MYIFSIDGAGGLTVIMQNAMYIYTTQVEGFRYMSFQPRKKSKRGEWPMCKMMIGDVVYILPYQYGKSNPQTYVHVYGRQTGKKFKTEMMVDSRLRVERVW
jgi:hypothetical protein